MQQLFYFKYGLILPLNRCHISVELMSWVLLELSLSLVDVDGGQLLQARPVAVEHCWYRFDLQLC